MQKHKLSLEELRVESFATSEGDSERGTVAGHQVSEPYVCYTDEYCGCNDWISQRSCAATCYDAASGCATPPSAGCPTGGAFTCQQTCNGQVFTCGFVDTCIYPECTAPGATCA